MGARTNFWLYVHELTLCLDEEGETIGERHANILMAMNAMPPLAKEEIARELRYLVGTLNELIAVSKLEAV